MINRGGIKVYPEEIDLLLKSHPEISDACAFAVPDPIAGQTVGAAVVFRDQAVSFDSIETWFRERALYYKVPSRWFSLSGIPITERGKVSRSLVAKLCGIESQK